METISKTRPGNVTPFVLAGRWALDGLDQPTMRWLSKTAKRKHVAVADIIYEAIDSFVAKCEAEGRTRNENHQVSDFAKKAVVDGSLIRVRQTQSAFHPHAQRTAFRRRDVHQQSRSFARLNQSLRYSPNSTRLC
jgi:hypothetical protein